MNKSTYFLIIAVILAACDEFLDAKPSKDIVTPNSLEFIEDILNFSTRMNIDLTLGYVASDDYITTDQALNNYQPWQKSVYLWEEEPFQLNDVVFDWNSPYNQIFTANVAESELEKLINVDDTKRRHLIGTTAFYRAYGFYNLSQLFLPHYSINGEFDNSISIPYRETPVITQPSEMVNAEEMFLRITRNLDIALENLNSSSTHKINPNLAAAHALAARVYFTAEDYEKSYQHARRVLEFSTYQLIDYNQLSPSAANPIEQFNSEVIFHSEFLAQAILYSQLVLVNPELLSLYKDGDLRKSIYFITRPNGNINFRASYTGRVNLFGGLALDEVYLTLAESAQRTGRTNEALEAINFYLSKRYTPETFVPFRPDSSLLEKIILERRKGLAFRANRWSDLRRLNRDPRFQKTLFRTYQGVQISLLPNSPIYTLPVPPLELN